MSDIVLTAGVRSNLLQLQKTADLITVDPDQACHRQAGQHGARQSDQLLHRAGPDEPRQRPGQPARLDGAAASTPSRPPTTASPRSPSWCSRHRRWSARRSRPPTPRSAPASPPSSTPSSARSTSSPATPGFNGINLLDSTNSANLTVTLNETGTSSVTITAVDFTATGLAHQQRGQQLGRHAPTSRRQRRPDGRPDHAALPGPGVRLEPVDRADPPGLHQGDDQHAADRRRLRSRSPIPTKRAPTCSPCRPASSFRPPPCRSPRRPARPCSACSSNRRAWRAAERGSAMALLRVNAGWRLHPANAICRFSRSGRRSRHGAQGRTQAQRTHPDRRIGHHQLRSAVLAGDRGIEPDPAREGHPDGAAGRHAGQAHLSRGAADVHVARPARAPRDLFRAGAPDRAGGAQHLGLRRDYQ